MNSKYTLEELREISRECRRIERKYYLIKGINALVVILSVACAVYLAHIYHVRPPGRYFARIPVLFFVVVVGISFWLMHFLPMIHRMWDKVKHHRLKRDASMGIHRDTIPHKE